MFKEGLYVQIVELHTNITVAILAHSHSSWTIWGARGFQHPQGRLQSQDHQKHGVSELEVLGQLMLGVWDFCQWDCHDPRQPSLKLSGYLMPSYSSCPMDDRPWNPSLFTFTGLFNPFFLISFFLLVKVLIRPQLVYCNNLITGLATSVFPCFGLKGKVAQAKWKDQGYRKRSVYKWFFFSEAGEEGREGLRPRKGRSLHTYEGSLRRKTNLQMWGKVDSASPFGSMRPSGRKFG